MFVKALLTVVAGVVWFALVFGNMAGAGRTAASMQLKLGISETEARRRTTTVVLLWNLVLTAMAFVALVFIWTVL